MLGVTTQSPEIQTKKSMPATLPHQSSDTPKQEDQPLRIGNVDVDPPVLQAPMAGYTNYAFRQVVREFGGAGLLATEMIAARSAIWLETNRRT